LIKQISIEKRISVKEFAEKLPCSRMNVYDIFKRQSINSELLQKISKILDCDFSVIKDTDTQNRSIMALIKISVSKFNELSADNSFEIIMSKEFP
jgi:DNA-binding Xre family transcriptional regulator